MVPIVPLAPMDHQFDESYPFVFIGHVWSPYGKFTLARQELKKVALKADSINYEMRWRTTFRENIKLTMKLFDALTDLP